MKNQQKLELINGHFSPKESREILMNMFSKKIQFHQLKNFSSQERNGHDDETAVKRIPALHANMALMMQLLDQAEADNLSVEINALVNLEFVKKEVEAFI